MDTKSLYSELFPLYLSSYISFNKQGTLTIIIKENNSIKSILKNKNRFLNKMIN